MLNLVSRNPKGIIEIVGEDTYRDYFGLLTSPRNRKNIQAAIEAGVVDAVLYQGMFGYKPIVKANGSNLLSALVDSAVFIVLAFGSPILWMVILQSYLAKLAGGLFWSLLLFGAWRKPAPNL